MEDECCDEAGREEQQSTLVAAHQTARAAANSTEVGHGVEVEDHNVGLP
jgi:hypothetical protein